MAETLVGIVESRTSGKARSSGPPGESDLLELNPQRREMILFATQWSRLESGSLNLRVSGEVLDTLKTHEPTIEEEGSTVHYPKPYQHIPELRKKYLYYSAIARANDTQAEVLVRRAENPVPNRLELFAEVNLRDFLGVQDGDELTVEIK